jgi:hypothetical protein
VLDERIIRGSSDITAASDVDGTDDVEHHWHQPDIEHTLWVERID